MSGSATSSSPPTPNLSRETSSAAPPTKATGESSSTSSADIASLPDNPSQTKTGNPEIRGTSANGRPGPAFAPTPVPDHLTERTCSMNSTIVTAGRQPHRTQDECADAVGR